MTPKEKEHFIREYAAYLRWTRLPEPLPASREEIHRVMAAHEAHEAANPHTDVSDDMFTLIHDQAELAWELLLTIAALIDDPDLGRLGAGDLETFVHVQGGSYAARIEQEIRKNPKIRKASESLYIGSGTPAQIGRRFNAALRESGVAEQHIIDWWSSPSGSV